MSILTANSFAPSIWAPPDSWPPAGALHAYLVRRRNASPDDQERWNAGSADRGDRFVPHPPLKQSNGPPRPPREDLLYVRRDPTNNGETGTCLELQRSVRVEWAFMRIEPVAGFGRRLNRRPLRSLVVATILAAALAGLVTARQACAPLSRTRSVRLSGNTSARTSRRAACLPKSRWSASTAGFRCGRIESSVFCSASAKGLWVGRINIDPRMRTSSRPVSPSDGRLFRLRVGGEPGRDPRSQNPLASRGISTVSRHRQPCPWWEPADCIGPTSRSGSLIIVEGDRLCAG